MSWIMTNWPYILLFWCAIIPTLAVGCGCFFEAGRGYPDSDDMFVLHSIEEHYKNG